MLGLAAVFRRASPAVATALVLLSSSCAGGNAGPASDAVPGRPAGRVAVASPFDASELFGKFKHVVVVVQENRTPDNLFNGLPGADTVRVGLNSQGQYVNLQAVSLTATYDIEHTHKAFLKEYAHGKMNGFDLVGSHCGGTCPPADVRAYAYVKTDQTHPYFDMAEQYAFADRMFESNQGPSFPAHLYILSGSSRPDPYSTLEVAENPRLPSGGSTGGCDSPPGSLVALIDEYGNENDYTFPCVGETSILQSLDDKHRTWHYYQAHGGAGLWNAADALRDVRHGSGYETNVLYPPTQFFKDVKAGRMADVSFITPTADNSDHAGITNRTGPSWVASVVNAVGKSKYWTDTAIFVTWDDWGGWYDHVAPQMYTSYELGFRVPLVVISPYTPRGYVSHAQHEFGSILKFIEEDFGLESLGTTDMRADDLTDCFDFQLQPRRFVHINAPRSEADFLRDPGRVDELVDY